MRLVVTSDTHFPFSADKIPDGDVFIHCGDLMYTGYESEWYPVVDSLAALPHKTKLLIAGNHDYHLERYPAITKAELRRRANVRYIEGPCELDGLSILAIPYVTGLPGWAFNKLEIHMGDWLSMAWPHHVGPSIVLSHGPMYKVLDAINPEQVTSKSRNEVGSWALANWYHKLEKKPEYFFHGHIHESYGEHHEWGTSFYNVANCNRDYEQVNAPVIIDL